VVRAAEIQVHDPVGAPGREHHGERTQNQVSEPSLALQAVSDPLQHVFGLAESLAERTGLEPATPGVTGRYSNQLNYRSAFGGANAIGLNNKATSNFGCTRSVTPAGVSATAPSSPKAGGRICPTRATSTKPKLRRFVQHPFRHRHNLLRNHYV